MSRDRRAFFPQVRGRINHSTPARVKLFAAYLTNVEGRQFICCRDNIQLLGTQPGMSI